MSLMVEGRNVLDDAPVDSISLTALPQSLATESAMIPVRTSMGMTSKTAEDRFSSAISQRTFNPLSEAKDASDASHFVAA
jgi:hypothetical protein